MRRREFLTALAVGTAGASVTAGTVAAATSTVDYLEFDSTASLIDADGGEFTDTSLIAVYAEDEAHNEDADGNGDAVVYSSSTQIPLVAVDGGVVGFGATLVSNEANFRSGNEEFLLNVWDAEVGSGTVLYDEGHDQYHTLDDFSNFRNYAENNGYTVTATSTLADDLSGADAAWITGPATAFTDSELSALSDFVSNGGTLFLHDRADYSDYDETANLNDVPAACSVAFRFNDDQVLDETNNSEDKSYKPTTDVFDTDYDYFADRPGLEIDPDTVHDVAVKDVADGDTVDVEFDSGRVEPVRVLGLDTPEKESNSQYERTQEWEGIEDETYLQNWADEATTYAKDELGGGRVDLSFDDAEPGIFDEFGRLLGYIHYDADGDGSRDTFYNEDLVAKGYARLYSSGFGKHEAFYDAEAAAQSNSRRVWTESDPANSTEIRNRDADDLFFPAVASVATSDGALDRSRAPVVAESEASQSGGTVSYDSDIPLVGVDDAAGVAMVGSTFVDEDYEQSEGFAVDTSDFENFVILSNLIDYLTDRDGQVLIDNGHGQFTADWSLSAEEAAYYQRFLEGVDVDFDGVVTLSSANLDRARALVVAAPADSLTASEKDAIASFRDDGGAVILLGSADATSGAVSNLDDLAAALGSDLRLNGGQVTDATNNVNDDETIPTSTRFDTSYPLFDAYDGSLTAGSITVKTVHEDAQGDEYDNLNDEYVVFENPDDGDIDLTGYAVEDEADHRYDFPSGFVLGGGDTVTLHTGSGTDTETDLYWGSGSPIWNNSGDTVYVFDDAGNAVVEYTY